MHIQPDTNFNTINISFKLFLINIISLLFAKLAMLAGHKLTKIFTK